MSNPEFYEKLKNSNEKELNQVLISACYDGNLEVVQYVLTSEDLSEHANIHYNRDNPFYWILFKGHVDIIEYLVNDFNIEKTTLIEHHLDSFKNKDLASKVKEMFNSRDINKVKPKI